MQIILIRYAAERLMYRLSVSAYRDRFILKGAWLFHVWGIARRATRDMDFLASVQNSSDAVIQIFTEVVQVPVPHDDGLTFDPATFIADEIQVDAEYAGVRLRLVAMLGNTAIHTQIDLGFSEALANEAVRVVLPVILDFEAPELRAYSYEAAIAEKTEAIVKLGTVTTRFKDFFDIYLLSNEIRFEGTRLLKQVIATFDHRETAFTEDLPVALSDAFANEEASQQQWSAFVRRNAANDAPTRFADVLHRVREFIYPILLTASQVQSSMAKHWLPESGWTDD
jgi:predicted nucleotidyltransferase component of viral defense system